MTPARQVYQLDLNNNLIATYKSTYQAEHETNIARSKINRLCLSGGIDEKGNKWAFDMPPIVNQDDEANNDGTALSNFSEENEKKRAVIKVSEIYSYQNEYNKLYSEFVDDLGIAIEKIDTALRNIATKLYQAEIIKIKIEKNLIDPRLTDKMLKTYDNLTSHALDDKEKLFKMYANGKQAKATTIQDKFRSRYK